MEKPLKKLFTAGLALTVGWQGIRATDWAPNNYYANDFNPKSQQQQFLSDKAPCKDQLKGNFERTRACVITEIQELYKTQILSQLEDKDNKLNSLEEIDKSTESIFDNLWSKRNETLKRIKTSFLDKANLSEAQNSQIRSEIKTYEESVFQVLRQQVLIKTKSILEAENPSGKAKYYKEVINNIQNDDLYGNNQGGKTKENSKALAMQKLEELVLMGISSRLQFGWELVKNQDGRKDINFFGDLNQFTKVWGPMDRVTTERLGFDSVVPLGSDDPAYEGDFAHYVGMARRDNQRMAEDKERRVGNGYQCMALETKDNRGNPRSLDYSRGFQCYFPIHWTNEEQLQMQFKYYGDKDYYPILQESTIKNNRQFVVQKKGEKLLPGENQIQENDRNEQLSPTDPRYESPYLRSIGSNGQAGAYSIDKISRIWNRQAAESFLLTNRVHQNLEHLLMALILNSSNDKNLNKITIDNFNNTSGPDRSSWLKVLLTGNPGLNIKSLSDAGLRDKALFKPATPFPECFWDCEINHHDPFVISMINKHKLGILPEGYVRDLASEMKMEAPIEHEHLSISTDLIKWALPITEPLWRKVGLPVSIALADASEVVVYHVAVPIGMLLVSAIEPEGLLGGMGEEARVGEVLFETGELKISRAGNKPSGTRESGNGASEGEPNSSNSTKTSSTDKVDMTDNTVSGILTRNEFVINKSELNGKLGGRLQITPNRALQDLPNQVTIPEGSLETNIQITTKARSSIFGATSEESTIHALYSAPNKEIYIVDPNTNQIQLYTKANQFETELARLNNQYKSEQTQIAKELREGELQAKGSKEQESTPKQPETEQLPCISFRPRDYYKQKESLVALTSQQRYQNLRDKFLSRPVDTLLGVEEVEAATCSIDELMNETSEYKDGEVNIVSKLEIREVDIENLRKKWVGEKYINRGRNNEISESTAINKDGTYNQFRASETDLKGSHSIPKFGPGHPHVHLIKIIRENNAIRIVVNNHILIEK